MQKRWSEILKLILVLLYSVSHIWFPVETSYAKSKLPNVEEGVYSLDYVILHAQTDSVSIANDYFEKPATYIVHNGKHYIRFMLNHSEWTKELQSPLGDSFVDVKVIQENKKENTRIVQFQLDRDLTEPIAFKMHVFIETMDPVYDHRYTVRFDFDLDTLKKLDQQTIEKMDISDEDFLAMEEKDSKVSNKSTEPKESNTLLYGTLLLIALIVFSVVFYKIRKKRSSKEE